MHDTALAFARAHVDAHGPYRWVTEFGSLDINGSARVLFERYETPVTYVGVDLQEGPGVDVVADICTLDPADFGPMDLVVCMEVLEHAPDQRGVVEKAGELLRPGGRLVLTAACDPRAPHSGIDEFPIRPWEHYRNAVPAELQGWLSEGWRVCSLDTSVLADVYVCAERL